MIWWTHCSYMSGGRAGWKWWKHGKEKLFNYGQEAKEEEEGVRVSQFSLRAHPQRPKSLQWRLTSKSSTISQWHLPGDQAFNAWAFGGYLTSK